MATTKPKGKDNDKTGATTTPTVTEPIIPTSSVVEAPALQAPTKTYDDHYKTAYNNQINTFTPGYEALKTANDEYLTGYDSSVDTQTATTTAAYQQQIDAAPAMSRPLYDANAIDEAINRKKVQEGMANMGMTDSGLSSSMQTAMAIQKSNADHQVRQQERAYVQDLETAISNVIAQGESAKQAERARINKATADYYANGIANISNSAATAASDMVATDWDNTWKVYDYGYRTAEREDTQNNELEEAGWDDYYKRGQTALQGSVDSWLSGQKYLQDLGLQDDQQTWLSEENGKDRTSKETIASINAIQKNSAAYSDLVTHLIGQGASNNDAAIYAAVISGGTGNEATDAWNQRYIEARRNGASESDAVTYADGDDNILTDVKTDNDLAVVEKFVGTLGSLDFSSFFGDAGGAGNLWGTWFQNETGDGRVVASHIKKTLNNSKGFGNLTENQQNMVIQYAIAKAVNTGWSKAADDKDNITRINSACKDMGLSDAATKEVLDTYYSMRA